jgi:hypothetical protein
VLALQGNLAPGGICYGGKCLSHHVRTSAPSALRHTYVQLAPKSSLVQLPTAPPSVHLRPEALSAGASAGRRHHRISGTPPKNDLSYSLILGELTPEETARKAPRGAGGGAYSASGSRATGDPQEGAVSSKTRAGWRKSEIRPWSHPTQPRRSVCRIGEGEAMYREQSWPELAPFATSSTLRACRHRALRKQPRRPIGFPVPVKDRHRRRRILGWTGLRNLGSAR